jgi:hypothetical protein
MNWLSRKDQLCGIVNTYNTKTNDAVLWKGQSEWMLNDDSRSFRSAARSGAMFHFRIWEDLLSTSLKTLFNEIPLNSTSDTTTSTMSSCFITYLNLDKKTMNFVACDAMESIEIIPVMTWREWRAAKNKEWRAQQRREEMLEEDDDFFYNKYMNS